LAQAINAFTALLLSPSPSEHVARQRSSSSQRLTSSASSGPLHLSLARYSPLLVSIALSGQPRFSLAPLLTLFECVFRKLRRTLRLLQKFPELAYSTDHVLFQLLDDTRHVNHVILENFESNSTNQP